MIASRAMRNAPLAVLGPGLKTVQIVLVIKLKLALDSIALTHVLFQKRTTPNYKRACVSCTCIKTILVSVSIAIQSAAVIHHAPGLILLSALAHVRTCSMGLTAYQNVPRIHTPAVI